MSKQFLIMSLLVLLLACSGKEEKKGFLINQVTQLSFPNGSWVDLTYDFDRQTIYWPTAEGFQLDTVFEGKTEGDYYYAAFKFSSAEHGGTHLDAPVHFFEGRKTVDQLSIDQLNGQSMVIDVSGHCTDNRDYQITTQDIEDWEKENGMLPDHCILFFRTGYGKFWPDRKKYMGTLKLGQEGVDNLHFPGIHPETATWLVKNRKIRAVGLDTPSIDYGQSRLFETHRILFEHNIPAFENVANLDLLPTKGAWVIALPMKIKGGSGAPLRMVGLIP